jgi:hypothetical protein
MALYVDIAVGDALTVGNMTVRLQFKTGKKARLKIEAPRDMELTLKKESVSPQ